MREKKEVKKESKRQWRGKEGGHATREKTVLIFSVKSNTVRSVDVLKS